ncbi:MAG: hypothetical protein JWM05_3228 [Acidimicrobiales bacterium]|nr:hypothetical protein [Acidimicrobiales bacterium]
MTATRDDAPAEPATGVRTVGGDEPRTARRAAAPRAAAASREDASRLPRPARPWALMAIAVLGLAGTLGFGLAWRQARGDRGSAATAGPTGPAADMQVAARDFAMALTTFDGATIDRDVARLDKYGTGKFGDELSQFFSTKIRTQLKEAQASSRGDIRSLYVESFDGDRGRAFAVVDQTIANNRFPQPQADTLRLDLGLKLVDGAWKVFDVQTVGTDVARSPGSTPATPTTR